MYRIELTPGEETVFRTLEELAIGVRNGLVTPRSRIYHNASEKWLPIEFHPHYKKALQLPIGRPSEPPPRGSDKPRMDTLSFAAAPSASKKAPEAVKVAEAISERASAMPSEAAQHTGPAPQVEPPVTIDHDFNFETHDRAPIRSEQLEARPTPAIERALATSPRPDSYLPASARLVADDPPAVIAPPTMTVPWASPPSLPEPVSTGAASLAPEPFELPTVSYPEITPAEAPVVERSGPARGRRSLQIAVAMAVLAAGGYLTRSFYSPVARSADRSESVQKGRPTLPAVAERPIQPASASPQSSVVTAATHAKAPAVVNRAPLTAPPAAPASSGFAAALEPRAQASGPAPITPRIASAPAAASSDSTAVAALPAPAPLPAPIDLPVLTGGLPQVTAPVARNDSAMKRILRAVSGGKDAKPLP